MRANDGPGSGRTRAIGAEHEGEPARREPVAHQQRADHADDGAGDARRSESAP